jgi:hypothetical protein
VKKVKRMISWCLLCLLGTRRRSFLINLFG